MKNNKSLKPIKSLERDHSTGDHYWMCPKCNNWVGGYIITGPGENDWGYKKSTFCDECGTKILWE